jgi:hypothetical protein
MARTVPQPPNKAAFFEGIRRFLGDEPRDPMYTLATRLLNMDWGDQAQMADDLGVLLLTWNQAFYRYGEFEYRPLERAIRRNLPLLTGWRRRAIATLGPADDPVIRRLFDEFLEALRAKHGRRYRRTPVGVAKALHLLCPGFLPLWDFNIAAGFGCRYANDPSAAYLKFCYLTKEWASRIRSYGDPPKRLKHTRRTLVKLIDEYCYSRWTL